jgi:1-acyl-sn-glycerol-3-phosphate acyltransferase
VIRLAIVLVVLGPSTLWYAMKMRWAAWRGGPGAARVCDESPRRWALLLLRAAGVDVVFEGDEALDPGRPQILFANHLSWFDVLALVAHVPGRCVFVAKKELETVPLFGPAAKAAGHIFIDRQDRSQAVVSLQSARQNLEEASPTIIIFPEGTRSPSGALQEFKKGAFVLAILSGTELVPAAISGSFEIMRKGSLLITPGTVRVRFGAPIPVAGYELGQRNELTRKAREALLALQSNSGATAPPPSAATRHTDTEE